jgi:hypothetical protein
MVLTRDFKETIVARVKADPAFAKALLDEAASLFFEWRSRDRKTHATGFGECDHRV